MRSVGFVFLLFPVALVPTNCSNSWGKFWEVPPEDPLAKCRSAVSGDSISMICVPANTTGFSRGWSGQATPVHTVASITGFAMGKFEVQKGEWDTVKTWATANGYIFTGTQTGTTNQHPAAQSTWREAIIWCNAASQLYGLKPVYYTDSAYTLPLKVVTTSGTLSTGSGQEDNPYVLWSANGYRLPTEAEWEYAARYIDGQSFLRGDAPPGWQDNNPANGLVDAAEINAVAWSSNNAAGSTKGVGQLAATPLGFHDMAGNLFEAVFDWDGAYTTSSPYTDADSAGAVTGTGRRYRGGAYNIDPAFSQLNASNRSGTSVPGSTFSDKGLRVVRRP